MIQQATLDVQMVEKAILKDKHLRQLGIRKGTETWNGGVKKLLTNSIDEVASGIREWIDEAYSRPGVRHTSVKFLEQLNSHVAAALANRVILDAVTRERTISSVASKIGKTLEDEARFTSIKKEHPRFFSAMDAYMKREKRGQEFRINQQKKAMRIKDSYCSWTATERVHVGLVCLEIFKSRTGLIEFTKRYLKAKRALTYVIPSDDCMRWIEDYHKNTEALNPVYMPMVVPPNRWVDGEPTSGGYQASFQRPVAIVKTFNTEFIKELEGFSMPEVYSSVNKLQAVPWRINDRLFQVMKEFWDNGLEEIGGLPLSKVRELPRKPEDISTNREAMKAYCQEATAVYTSNVRTKMHRISMVKILSLSQQFLGQDLYFPVQCDFRGRAYYIPPFLNPQGSGYARALLDFAEAKPLGENGANWLRVHIANCFGEDKVSFEARQAWVEMHREQIMACAGDPFTHRWWLEADEPWMFLRACIEYQSYSHNPKEFKSSLPILLDASSNGLQILSLLKRDAKGAEATNCCESGEPKDIYSRVADELVCILKNRPEPQAKQWLDFGIERSLVKRCVMTLPYGATLYGFAKHLEEAGAEQAAKSGKDWTNLGLRKSTMWMARRVSHAIAKVVPNAAVTMSWLKEIAREVSEENIPVRWVSPCGFLVNQSYFNQVAKTIKTTIAGSFRYVVLNESIPEEINSRRQIQAIAPNFVHSLDAAVMHRVVNKCPFPLVTIHDCYGTHAGNIDELLRQTKEAFVEVFTPCQLTQFQEQLGGLLPSGKLLKTNTESVDFGDFEIAKIRNASYLFG